MSLSLSEFDYLRELVLQHSAISIDRGNEYLAESRLSHVALKEGQASVGALLCQLRGRPFGPLHRKVLDAMTNNETWFFRDLHPFEMIKRVILPDLIEKRRNVRNLNIWSAAASSGQEAYSLVMLLDEHFPELRTWSVRILGTDICTSILNRARAARYSQLEVNRGLPAAMLARYFRQEGLEWVLKDSIRNRVDFEILNLSKPWPPLAAMDLILLRNVLIYFEVPMKREILSQVRRVMMPDGYLVLGCAESTISLDDHFERIAVEKTACYRPRSRP
jgi:chemotaxis protein methyltransferase CheR